MPRSRRCAISYREARTAEALGKQTNTRSVAAYEDMRLYAALQASATSDAGKALAEEMLGPLQQADGQTGNLASVVLAYIEEAGNLNAAARRLHLHRNTMLYKPTERPEHSGWTYAAPRRSSWCGSPTTS